MWGSNCSPGPPAPGFLCHERHESPAEPARPALRQRQRASLPPGLVTLPDCWPPAGDFEWDNMVVLGQVTGPPMMLIHREGANVERAAPQLPQPREAGAALTQRCAQSPARGVPPAPQHSRALFPQAGLSPHPTASPGHPPCFAAPPGTHPSAFPPSQSALSPTCGKTPGNAWGTS